MVLSITLVLVLSSSTAIGSGNRIINVVSTLQIYSTIVKKIGGEFVNSLYIVPEGTDIHDYSLTQNDVKKIRASDLVVLADSKFFSIDSQIKEVKSGGEILDFPDYNATLFPVGTFKHDFHGYWLYPNNTISIAHAIYLKLREMNPANGDYYYRNYESFVQEVNSSFHFALSLIRRSGMVGSGVILAIPGVFYIAKAMGLNVQGLLTEGPSQFASVNEISKMKRDIESGRVSFILNAVNLGDSRAGEIAKEISRETGVKIAYVDIFSANNYTSLLISDAAVISSVSYVESESSQNCDVSAYLIAIAGLGILLSLVSYIAYTYRKELLR